MASSSGTQNVQPTIAFASVGVAEVAKNGRGMKTDPAWEHSVMIDEATRRVRYNYSPQEFTGGVYRFKHHLAGTSKDAKSCNVVEAKVGADSNGKRKSVWEIARKDRFIRGVTTLTQTTINGA
ncbi:hypothetical protein TSUD_314710 [Trifolium subterraneum]|uniref:Uncharacterized protein n=1 Tax=Trifolium subterraneum TaxID=3900 RepID=A0A2Z6M2A3_TRISU|nr:hypothetical protein TSUD_314710 [Trifolium subterraneum]